MVPNITNGEIAEHVPHDVKFNRAANELYYGDRVLVMCDEGYHYKSSISFVLTCSQNGELNDEEPECIGKMHNTTQPQVIRYFLGDDDDVS